VAVQRKANRHVFSELQQHRLFGFVRGRLRGQSRQGLLQRVLSANRHRRQTRLESGVVHSPVVVFSRLSELREERDHRANLFFSHCILRRTFSAGSTGCTGKGSREAGHRTSAQKRGGHHPSAAGFLAGDTDCSATASTSTSTSTSAAN